jgi:hypothetical protein
VKDMIKALLLSLMMLACGGPLAGYAPETAQNPDFREREEINQKYTLAPGARVEVSSIRGHVQVLNSDSGMAEVQIIRTARTRADLEYHKVEVEHSGNSLVVRGVQEPEARQRQNIRVDHQVILKVPRSVELKVSSVSGHLKVGDIDGETRVTSISGDASIGNVGGKLNVRSISGSLTVGDINADARVNSISGNVRLSQVNGSIDVTSVSGTLSAKLVSLSPQGIHIRSISGSVEIGFKRDVNADFSAVSISGQVHLDVPNVVRDNETNSSTVRARIGAGGTPIEITSVSGNIRLTRS